VCSSDLAVSHANVGAYLEHTLRRYGISSTDRCSQTFDLTFDLSVHDIFVTLSSGACLCPIPDQAMMAPAWSIVEKDLTVWFSVPSVAMLMAKMRMLTPGRFPNLRLSLFCGEALDRKSTRLNSSHVKISYAVFCLKKKK